PVLPPELLWRVRSRPRGPQPRGRDSHAGDRMTRRRQNVFTTTLAVAGAAVVAIGVGACVSTKGLMTDAVNQRAMQDLVCDEASTKIRQVGTISHYQGGRQGTIERAT